VSIILDGCLLESWI